MEKPSNQNTQQLVRLGPTPIYQTDINHMMQEMEDTGKFHVVSWPGRETLTDDDYLAVEQILPMEYRNGGLTVQDSRTVTEYGVQGFRTGVMRHIATNSPVRLVDYRMYRNARRVACEPCVYSPSPVSTKVAYDVFQAIRKILAVSLAADLLNGKQDVKALLRRHLPDFKAAYQTLAPVAYGVDGLDWDAVRKEARTSFLARLGESSDIKGAVTALVQVFDRLSAEVPENENNVGRMEQAVVNA